MVPRPLTGGGGNIAMNASWIPAYFLFNSAAMAAPLSDGSLRSENGFRVEKTIPALELLVKPLIDRPGKDTELSTPGCVNAMSLMRRITSSVGSGAAPPGNPATPTDFCLP